MNISKRFLSLAGVMAILSACNTYYDPSDSYTRGLRFYDRGMTGIARQVWEPMLQHKDCDAEARYALVLFQQSDIPPDQPKGLAMMMEAANRGQPLAQLSLGSLYHAEQIPQAGAGGGNIICDTCGIPHDPVESVKWLLLARRNAVYDNQRKFADWALPQVKQAMTPQDIARAETLASQWMPQGATCKPRSLW